MIGSQNIRLATTNPIVAKSRWSKTHWVYLLLLLNDTIAIGVGLGIAYVLRFNSHFSFFADSMISGASHYRQLAFFFIPAGLLVFLVFRLYDTQFLFGGLDEYSRVFNACTTGIMMIMVLTFLLPELVIARGWLLLSWFSVTGLVGLGRFLVRRLVYRLRENGLFCKAMLIVGANEEGKAIAEQLASNPSAGIWVVGFVDDDLKEGTEVLPNLCVLGSTHTLRKVVHELGVEELMISASALSRPKLMDIFRTYVNSSDVKVRLSSGLFEIVTTGVRVTDIGRVPLLSVNRVRLTRGEIVLKILLDYVGATLGLIVLLPYFVLIGIAIKLSSPGPVFHRRRVVGVGGREFDAFKFRTMVVDADKVLEQNDDLKKEFEKNFKLKDDPRVTTIGRLLRKTSIDEFPQLINVLRGEMSLVGPRMITREEVVRYGKWDLNLHTVKPGITGLWQVRGRSEVDYQDRVLLDMHYIRNYTVWLDLQIMFQTIPAVLRNRGAY